MHRSTDIAGILEDIKKLRQCDFEPGLINSAKARFPSQSGCEESMISAVGDTCWPVFHYYCTEHGFDSCADNVVCAHQMLMETKKPTGFWKLDRMTDTSWVECQEKIHHASDSVLQKLREECLNKNTVLLEMPNIIMTTMLSMVPKYQNIRFIYLPVDKWLLSEMAQISPLRTSKVCTRLTEDYKFLKNYMSRSSGQVLYIPARSLAENLQSGLTHVQEFITGKSKPIYTSADIIKPTCISS